MGQTTISPENSIRPAPRWFRKFKKIFTNLENSAIVLLLATGHSADSLLILIVKTGTSTILTNLETLLANGEEYVKVDQ